MTHARTALVTLVVAAAICLVRPVPAAEEKPSATLTLEAKSVAVGIGWTWGSGTLSYGGKKHHFKLDGLTVNGVGVDRAEATGNVYHLKKLSEFAGTYAAVEAGGAAGGGASIATMRNEHGVRITLHSTSQGISVQVGPEGMKISLED